MRGGLVGFVLAQLPGGACGGGGDFQCVSDTQCGDGQCQPDGFCSFPDGECESGQRYGEFAREGLARQCVPASETSDSTGEAPQTSSTTATTLALTSGGSSSSSSTGDEPDASSGGSSGEAIDPDLLLWLEFEDPAQPLRDSSVHDWSLQCDPCPGTDASDGQGSVGLFDGAATIATLPWDPVLDTASWSVALWVRFDTPDQTAIHTAIARPYGLVGFQNAWELFFRDEDLDGATNLVLEVGLATPPDPQLLAPVELRPRWRHVAAVYDGSTIALFVDGTLLEVVDAPDLLVDQNPIVIGGDIDDGLLANPFDGALDDVRLYSRALDGDEIATLAVPPA